MSRAALAVLAALAAGAPTPPAPATWVEDQVGLLTPATRTAIDVRLEDYQVSTGHQVVVWIGDTLGGAPLDDWAVRTFAAWKVGRDKADDGIAMFILAKDRTIDIEVGYGLEDKVPDATASRIIREVMAPKLKAGEADRAVTDGVEALLTAIEGRPWTSTATTTEPSAEVTTTEWIVFGIAGLAFLVFAIKYPKKLLWLLWWLFATGRFFSGGGARGGRSSGGFSGGGGRSGGGGARGGW